MGRSFRSELSQLSHQKQQTGSYILGIMDSFLKGGGEISEFYANKFVCLVNVFGCGWELNQWRIQDFPEVGAPTLQGAPTYDFAKISQKLHKIERIWTPGGGGSCPLCP